MADYMQYTTLSSNGTSFTLSPTTSKETPRTPSGLIVTAAVQTKDGWLGQVIVDKEITWQSAPLRHADHAIDAANKCVVNVIRGLFKAGTESDDE